MAKQKFGYSVRETKQLPVFKSLQKEANKMANETSTLDAEIAEVQQRFSKLEGERQELLKQREGFVKQVSELDKQLSGYVENIVRVQGEYAALTRLREKTALPVSSEKPS